MSGSGGGSTERLSRLLALVPYLLANPGVEVALAARHFGLTEHALVKDLELLFVCGLPGHLPDDLIEADWESGRIYLDNADTISRPLRLSLDEAVALLVGLRALSEIPGARANAAVASATAKLTEAAGELGRAADAISVSLDDDSDPGLRARAEQAAATGRRVRIRYLVPGRDEATEREVDPLRVVNLGGAWYLQGWCLRAEAHRTFRLSRVLHMDVLDRPVQAHPAPEPGHLDALFAPSPDDTIVELDLDARHRWVAEEYPAENLHRAGTGLVLTIRVADVGRIRQLALQSGGGVRVRSPRWLAQQVVDEARQALNVTGDHQT